MHEQQSSHPSRTPYEIEWPDDFRPLSENDLIDPIMAAIEHCYDLTPKEVEEDTPWRGPNLGKDDQKFLGAPHMALLAARIEEFHSEGKLVALGEIIELAIHLGTENGRRQFFHSRDMEVTRTKAKMFDMIEDAKASNWRDISTVVSEGKVSGRPLLLRYKGRMSTVTVKYDLADEVWRMANNADEDNVWSGMLNMREGALPQFFDAWIFAPL